MGGMHLKFCIGMPCCHVKGKIEQDLVVLAWQDAFDDRDPTLGKILSSETGSRKNGGCQPAECL